MDSNAYGDIWKRDDSLEFLNKRIHDGVPVEKLADRADGYCNTLFEIMFPYAKPDKSSKVLEFGSGVGWIMQSMLKKFSMKEIVGLEISVNMVKKAKERWNDKRAK